METVTAVAAVVIAVASLCATWRLSHAANARASMQILATLQTRWESDRVAASRRAAASTVRQGSKAGDMDRTAILNALELIAMATKERVIPSKMTWSQFADWLLSWWFIFLPAIKEAQRDAPGAYEDLAWTVKKFTELNRTRGIFDTPTWYAEYRDEFLSFEEKA